MSVLANFDGHEADMECIEALSILGCIGKLKYLEKIVTRDNLKLYQMNSVICIP